MNCDNCSQEPLSLSNRISKGLLLHDFLCVLHEDDSIDDGEMMREKMRMDEKDENDDDGDDHQRKDVLMKAIL